MWLQGSDECSYFGKYTKTHSHFLKTLKTQNVIFEQNGSFSINTLLLGVPEESFSIKK